MKTPNKISQHQNSWEDSHAACRDSPPRTIPRKPLPASPMKIFAGGKFQNKKPATAAANRSGRAVILPCPLNQ
ncbi:hypothetical protein D3C80_1979430 [compost metagenome]